MVNISEAVNAIKRVGTINARVVPTPNSTRYQIDIMEGGSWRTIATDLTQRLANDIVSKATNRVLLG